MTSDLKVRWFNTSGVMQAENTDYLSLAYTRGVNRPGIASITYAGNHNLITTVADKWRFEVWRRDTAHSLDWTREFDGIFRAIDLHGTAPGIAELICPGAMHMLIWRHVLWYAGTADRSAFSSEKAETILKTLVTYNTTSSASTANGRLRDGDLSVISVQADGAGGNTISHYCSWAQLLDTLQDVATVAGGDFDLVKTAVNAWEFRWYVGQLGTDRSATVTFADGLGNMGNPRYIENHIKEKTVALAAGKGEGAERESEIRTSGDYHVSTNNIEMFADARNVAEGNTVGLQAVADKKLDELKLRSEFTFDVLQTPATIYGVHYVLGDLVSVVNPFSESKETKKIDTVTVVQESGGGVSIKVEMANA